MAKTLNEILINVIIFLNILDYEVRALPGKVGISSTKHQNILFLSWVQKVLEALSFLTFCCKQLSTWFILIPKFLISWFEDTLSLGYQDLKHKKLSWWKSLCWIWGELNRWTLDPKPRIKEARLRLKCIAADFLNGKKRERTEMGGFVATFRGS